MGPNPVRKTVFCILAIALAAILCPIPARADSGQGATDLKVPINKDAHDLTQESSNPVGELWMITNQFNFNWIESDEVEAYKDGVGQFVWNFQPVLPFDLTDDLRMVFRPVVPIENSPYVSGPGETDHQFGIGDIELMALFAPINDSGEGFMWGVGPTIVTPSATDRHLGQGKWQLGVAAAGLYIDKKWTVGVFPQHWWDVGGDPDRDHINFTDLQYFAWYSPAPTWQIGMAPSIYIDWMQDDDDNKLTLPVGLGVAKLVKFGRLPVKFALEYDYAVIYPDDLPGNRWTIKLNITPILPKLF